MEYSAEETLVIEVGSEYTMESKPNVIKEKLSDTVDAIQKGIKKLIIGKGIQQIGDEAFRECRDLHEANLERESVKIADHVAVVTESAKFGLKALAKFADFSEIEVLATDRQMDEGLLCRLRARGLEVIQG